MKYVITILITIATLSATVIDIPGDHGTIQEGIHASSDGDTVLVQPGIYHENIDFNGHNITLGSLFLTTGDNIYLSQTTIHGNRYSSVVVFESFEDSTTILSGFTITNGSGSWVDGWCGGGIFIENASPTIQNLIVRDNAVTQDGFIPAAGGGICVFSNAHPIIQNVLIYNNLSTIGGGIIVLYGDARISNATITENHAEWHGGGVYLAGNVNHASVSNSIIWDNNSGIEYPDVFGYAEIQYTDISTLIDGIGNISADPLFVDTENNNYGLLSNSPCIDAGDPGSPFDPDNTIVDMGAFYFDQCQLVPDGVWDVSEIVEMVGCAIGINESLCPCYDVNEDGVVDIIDIVQVVAWILE